jgi:mannose-6-phosphate isomerase-like protein (cupin superfamily)
LWTVSEARRPRLSDEPHTRRIAQCIGRAILETAKRQKGKPGPTKMQPRRIEKPWGHELIWADTDRYVGKILHIKAGHALSLQYHERKDETIHLLRGAMRFQVGPSVEELKDVDLTEGQSYRITPGTVHRMVAITDADILEASTPDLDDVVRLEDRYGRS